MVLRGGIRRHLFLLCSLYRCDMGYGAGIRLAWSMVASTRGRRIHTILSINLRGFRLQLRHHQRSGRGILHYVRSSDRDQYALDQDPHSHRGCLWWPDLGYHTQKDPPFSGNGMGRGESRVDNAGQAICFQSCDSGRKHGCQLGRPVRQLLRMGEKSVS